MKKGVDGEELLTTLENNAHTLREFAMNGQLGREERTKYKASMAGRLASSRVD